jgi:NADPH:quinone reductase-like Zn-dependent oxidoreductase
MRAVVFTKRGGPDVLRVEERPDPVPDTNEVLIDVEAAGISFSEILARVGLYPNAPKPPAVLGYEVAGTVSAAGPEVAGLTAGARVTAFVRHGGYAERAVASEPDVLRLPDSMSFEQGAAIPLAFATAYGALVRFGAALPGERVLIHGAGGGVGSAAVTLARALELEVWGTASAGKQEALRELGVQHPLDYADPSWDEQLPPFDLALDALGGRSFRHSYDLLGAGGRLICYGASSVLRGERRSLLRAARTLVRTPRFNPMRQLAASKTVIGLDTIALWERRGNLGELIRPLESFLAEGRIKPTVAATFPLADAPAAHRFISERRNTGKVVLTT